jgi:hypothetical protein
VVGDYLQRHSQLYLALLTLVIFILVRQAPVDYTDGDSEHVLLTAQAIVQHGTIKLDAYLPAGFEDKVLDVGGHLYSYQPLGTSFFAVPAVWLANLRGQDMLDPANNRDQQKALAAFTVSAIFVLIYMIARSFAGAATSLLLGIVFTIGSSVASTLGAALWSHNLAIVFALAAVLLIVRDARGQLPARWAYAVGALLFGAYFVRPTMLALVVAALAYFAIWRRPLLVRAGLGFGIPLLMLLVFFRVEYGQFLPYYYQTGRLRFWPTPQRIYGLLLSPGRGLLIYNAFLLLILLGMAVSVRRLMRQPLFWLAIGWLALHLFSVLRWGYWWAGWSFGSRILVDTMPALLLLTLLVWVEMPTMLSRSMRRLALAAFIALALVGVFVNTVQGLYNPWTRTWNAWHWPDQDANYQDEIYMFDWRFPQFLASPELVERRNIEYRLNALPPWQVDEIAGPASNSVEFKGWYDYELGGADPCRWSEGKAAGLSFRVDSVAIPEGQSLAVEIRAGTHHTQTIPVLLNQTPLGVIDSQTHWEPSFYTFLIPGSLLRTSDQGPRVNELDFLIPGANSPASLDPDAEDTRVLGLCLWHTQLLTMPSP